MKQLFIYSLIGIIILSASTAMALEDIVINEVHFGGGAGSEWVELYVRPGGGGNINNWVITDQDGNSFTFPDLAVGNGEYIMFYTGSGTNDLDGPVYEIYADSTNEFWNDTGDDIYLYDDTGNDMDYIAYGTGGEIDPVPGTLSWSNDVDITGIGGSDAIALVPNGEDNDDGDDWFIRTGVDVSEGANNNPVLNMTHTGPATIDRGDLNGEIFRIVVQNTGGSTADTASITSRLPVDFSYISTSLVKHNTTILNPGDYTATDYGDSISWDFSAVYDALAPGDSLVIEYGLATNCNVTSSTPAFDGRAYGEDPQQNLIIGIGDTSLNMVLGNLVVEIYAIEKNGSPITPTTAPTGGLGDEFTLQVIISNTGEGQLYAIEDTTTWGSDLTYLSGPVGAGASYDGGNDRILAFYDSLAAGEDTSYTFVVEIDGCDFLYTPTDARDRCLTESESVTTGIVFQLRQPNITIDYPTDVGVVMGDSTRVAIPLENVGLGDAYDFFINTELDATPLVVTLVSSDWSYNSGTGLFTYTANGGTWTSGNQDSLIFYVRQPDLCTDISLSEFVIWEPQYESACEDTFETPVGIVYFYDSPRPQYITIDKTANPSTVTEGDNVDFTITVDLSDTNRVVGNVVMTDDIPSDFTINSTNSGGIGIVNVVGQTVTWTLSRTEAEANPSLVVSTTTNPIFVDPCTPVSPNNPNNTAEVTATDIHGCTLTDSDGASVTINVDATYPDSSLTQSKTIDPDEVETGDVPHTIEICTDFDFGDDMPGSWTGTVYTETLDATMSNVQNITYTYTDAASGVHTINITPTIALPTITFNLDSIAVISGDDAVAGDQLEICFDADFNPPALGSAVDQQYTVNSVIEINGNFDNCNPIHSNGEYRQNDDVTYSRTDVELSMSLPSTPDDGDTVIVDITVNVGNWPADNVLLSLYENNFDFIDVVSATGVLGVAYSENDQADSVQFDFGDDIAVGTGTLRVRVLKKCARPDTLYSQIFWDDALGDTYNDNASLLIPDISQISMTATPVRNVVDDCDTLTIDFAVNINTWDAVDAIITINTENYDYVSSSLTGFGATPIITDMGDSVVFDFSGETLVEGTSHIYLLTQKICGTDKDITGKMEWQNTCGTTDTTSANGEPLLNVKADVNVHFTPVDLTVDENAISWIAYITNRGAGDAFNSTFHDSLGEHLKFDSLFVNGTKIDPSDPDLTVNETPTYTIVDYDMGTIQNGATDTVIIYTRLRGSSCDLEDLNSTRTSVYQACPGDCQPPIELAGVPRFILPRANLRLENFVPSSVASGGNSEVVLCDTTEVLVRITNNGATHDYNIRMEYDLEQTGFIYKAGTAEMSINGGARQAIPDPTVTGATTFEWDKTLIPEFTDIPNGDIIEIYFWVQTSCEFSTHRQTSAEAEYSIPCQVALDGSSVSVEVSYAEMPNIGIRQPDIALNKDVRAGTSGTWENIISVAKDDTVQFRLQILNTGTAAAQNFTLIDSLPNNLNFLSLVPQGTAPGMTLQSTVINASTTTYTWDADDTVGVTTALGPHEYILTAVVTGCEDPVTNIASAFWGCEATGCQDLGTSITSGTVVTRPTIASATSVIASTDFNTCGGDMRIIVTNDSAMALNLNIRDFLPTGYIYEDGTSTMTSTDAGHDFTGMIEPDSISADSTVIKWEIDYIGSGEQITIEFHIKADGNYCDTDLLSDPPFVPDSPNVIEVWYDDSCNNTYPVLTSSTTAQPLTPDLDIHFNPAQSTAIEGQTLTWNIVLENNEPSDPNGVADGAADSNYVWVTLGSGFSNITNISNGGTLSGNVIYWDRTDIGRVNASNTWTASFDADVGSGDLTLGGKVLGYCLTSTDARLCTHSADSTTAYVGGVTVEKVHMDIDEPGTIIVPDSIDGTGSIGNILTQQVRINYFGSGNYENVYIRDILTDGLNYVEGSWSVINNTTPGPAVVNFSASGDSLTLIWSVADFTGFGEVTIEYQVQVDTLVTNAGQALPGTALPDTAHTDFDVYGITFDHTTPSFTATLTDTTYLDVREPYIADLTKTSNPASGDVEGTQTVVYTLRAVNTGTSPAYEVTFLDSLPIGMRDTNPTIDAFEVREDGGGTRNLLGGGYLSQNYDGGTGVFTVSATGDSTEGGLAPNDTLYLEYTVTVDDTVGAGTTLTNYGRVDSYSSLPGSVDRERIYPTTAPDSTTLTTPAATISCVATTEQSPAGQATIGEVITYTYTIIVPQNTVAYDPEVTTRVFDGLVIQDVVINGGVNGTSSLNYGNNYTTTTYEWDKIMGGADGDTVTVTVYTSVEDIFAVASGRDENNDLIVNAGDRTRVANGNNSSGFNILTWNAIDDDVASEQVISNISAIEHRIIEPELTSLTKNHGAPDNVVEGNEVIPFTINFENVRTTSPTNRGSYAYEVVVHDTLPSEMRDTAPTITSVTIDAAPLAVGTDYTTSWTSGTGVLEIAFIDSIPIDGQVEIQYNATVNSDIGASAAFQNTVVIKEYSSMRDTASYETTGGSASTAVPAPERIYPEVGPVSQTFVTTQTRVVKDVFEQQSPDNQATLGEVLTYIDTIIVYQNTTAYDVVLTDLLPDGVTLQSITFNGGINGVITASTEAGNGTTPIEVTWDEIQGGADGDTVTVTMIVSVDTLFTGLAAGDNNSNTLVDLNDQLDTPAADLTWNAIDGDSGTQDNVVSNTTSHVIIEPDLTNLAKAMTDEATSTPLADNDPVEGGRQVRYTITFDNTGNSPAHETIVVDSIPLGMQDIAPASIAVTVDATSLTSGVDFNSNWDGQFLTITFLSTTNATIDPGESATIEYVAQVDADIGAGAILTNEAYIQEYTSILGTPTYDGADGPERVYPQVGPVSRTLITQGLPSNVKDVASSFVPPVGTYSTGNNTTIGDTLTYRIETTVPNNTTAYQTTFIDSLVDGLTYVTSWAYDNTGTDIVITETITPLANGWTLVELDLGDLAGSVALNPYTIFIQVNVDQDYISGDPVARDSVLTNDVRFEWNVIDGDNNTRQYITSNLVSSTVIEPELTNLTKYVTDTNPALGSTTAGDSIVVANSTVDYEINFTNSGNSAAYDVVVRDTLPDDMRNTDPTGTVAIDVGARTLSSPGDFTVTYTGATGELLIEFQTPAYDSDARVDGGETVTITYTATLNNQILNASKPLDNSCFVTDYGTLPGNLPLERDTDSTPSYSDLGRAWDRVVVQPAQITKTPTGDNLRIGDTEDYTITVELGRQTRIYYPTLIDTLPEGMRMQQPTLTYNTGDIDVSAPILQSATPDSLTNGLMQHIWTWQFDTITNSAVVPQTFEVAYTTELIGQNAVRQDLFLNLSQDHIINNDISLGWNYVDHGSADSGQPDYQEIYTSTTHTVIQPDLNITKSRVLAGGDLAVSANEDVTYEIVVSNDGTNPAHAYEITVTDILPIGMRDTDPFTLVPLSYQINGGALTGAVTTNYDSDTGKITWTFDAADVLNAGNDLVIQYTARVDANVLDKLSGGESLTNEAQVVQWYGHPSSSFRREYGPGPKASVTLYIGGIYITPNRNSTVSAGVTVLYRHIVANLGSQADNITFTITTSEGWNWGIYQDDGSGNPTGASFTTLNLAAGERDSIVVQVFVPTETPVGTVDISTFTITSGNDSDITSMVTDETNVVGVDAGNLRLIKEVDKDVAAPGDTLLYTITYINVSTDTIFTVELTDPISQDVTFLTDGFGAGQDLRFVQPDGSIVYVTADSGDGDSDGGSYDNDIVGLDFTAAGVTSLAPGASGTVSYRVVLR